MRSQGDCSGTKWQRRTGTKGHSNTGKVFHLFFHFVPLRLSEQLPVKQLKQANPGDKAPVLNLKIYPDCALPTE